MTRDEITVKNSTNIEEATELLKSAKITGVPVVDKEENLVGILSEKDLLFHLEEEFPEDLSTYQPFQRASGFDLHTWVEDIMTKKIIAVDYDTPLIQVCRLLIDNHIHRVPVLKEGRLVGIISSLDIVKCMINTLTEINS